MSTDPHPEPARALAQAITRATKAAEAHGLLFLPTTVGSYPTVDPLDVPVPGEQMDPVDVAALDRIPKMALKHEDAVDPRELGNAATNVWRTLGYLRAEAMKTPGSDLNRVLDLLVSAHQQTAVLRARLHALGERA